MTHTHMREREREREREGERCERRLWTKGKLKETKGSRKRQEGEK